MSYGHKDPLYKLHDRVTKLEEAAKEADYKQEEAKPLKCKKWFIDKAGGLGHHSAFTHPQAHCETIRVIETLSYGVILKVLKNKYKGSRNRIHLKPSEIMEVLDSLGMIKEIK